jgi:Zn-dependent peptidase ImmA (M78 family)
VAEALITGKMIQWAIDRNRETQSSLAFRLHVKPEILNEWVTEYSRPSLHQAQTLAKKLRIPLGYLYLDTPPSENLPLPDLRTKSNEPSTRPSPNFLDVLYDALRKQEWYHAYLEIEGADPIPFIGKYKLSDSHNVVAKDMAHYLSIDNNLRRSCNSWQKFLSELIDRAEKARVMVLRSGIVGNNAHRTLDVDEFRGFAISDRLAPLVFINENDYKVAQIFTLAHEVAHLWINQSGVSNPDYTVRSNQQRNAIDQFCDSVAAEVLVPKDDFEIRWNDFSSLDDNLINLSRYYRVSSFVVLRRSYEFDKVPYAVFRQKYQELLTQSRKTPRLGGNFYNLFLSRNGRVLPKSILSAIHEGRILPSEAASLLNLSVLKVANIERYMLGAIHD